MKIALLTEKYTPDIGGLAISTGRLGHLLASAGHDVRVFAPTSSLPASEMRHLPFNGVSVTRFGAHKRVDDTLVDWFELLVEEHQRAPFDLLHGYFLPQAGFVAAYAGKYLNIPGVVSIRGNDIERAAFDPSKFSHVMYSLQNASALTTNASELAYKAKAFIDREVILIPNGIDTEHFRPVEKNMVLAEALNLNTKDTKGHEGFVVGFAGELREKKGLKTLLNGYAQINNEYPTALLIVGEVRDGEDRKIFDELKASIPNANIIVTGIISHQDMPPYYALMDVFAHPSLRDGMPNALLEAMACEKPVVATPVGGVLDVLKDGDNGILVPVNDVSAFTNAINELIKDEAGRKKLGAAARQKIVQEFPPQIELERNLKIYERLLQR